MNQYLDRRSVRLGGVTELKAFVGPPTVIALPIRPIGPIGTIGPIGPPGTIVLNPNWASLPLASTQTGNLFVDRNDANLHWYLPDFALADDIDPDFAFRASQAGQDQAGHPFNTATLTLRVHKFRPDDVVQFATANPAATIQEIPLAELAAVLTSEYTDDSGQQRQRTFSAASIQELDDGFLRLTFDGTILGSSVVGLYQDLRQFGKAVILLSASYEVWARQGTVFFPGNLNLQMRNLPAEEVVTTETHLFPDAAAVGRPPIEGRFPQPQPVAPGLLPGDGGPSRPPPIIFKPPPVIFKPPPVLRPLIRTHESWGKILPVGRKYSLDGYQLKFTVTTPTVASHVILSADDLKEFNKLQSEFEELKALGDIGARYPTLSRAYIGAISRSIVVVPRRYSIVRGKDGCAAMCLALVDSSAADGSRCKFEFDFTIAPEVSRIEMWKLEREIASNAELQDYHITFPDFLNDAPPSALLTAFKSSVQFAAGAAPHTFSLTVTIQDEGTETPAVANANLFILRLCSTQGTDLIGSLSLKLDDGYADPVLGTIDLNFSHTAGTDELDAEIDEAGGQIKLMNESPLDLQLTNYALIRDASVTEFPGVIIIPAGGTASVALPADHTGLKFAADVQLAIPTPMKKADVGSFLIFKTADVQQTQYVVAVDGSGVDFTKVDSVVAGITFATLPNVAPRELRLSRNIHADSTHIVVPLEDAVFSLPGTVSMAVHFVDPGRGDLRFTIENDFTVEPVLVLLQSDIEKIVPQV